MNLLTSYAEGAWQKGKGAGVPLLHAVTGEQIYTVNSEGLNFKSMLEWGRRAGGPKLRELTFHERARILKQIAEYLLARKEVFYAVSEGTGATKGDAWIDIDGGIGTLFTYASKGKRELPNETFYIDGNVEKISKLNTFAGQHVCVPLEGVALHINAFNFPCWGMLEKMAPSILAGMPVIIKPGTSTCYVTHAVVSAILASGYLPEGALQLVCGSVGDMFSYLMCQDVVTLTGSRSTGEKLKTHPQVVHQSVRFNLEPDSLNCSILAPDAAPGKDEFSLFIKEVVKEMTVKAGQKCTVIRRCIVPKEFEDAVLEALKKELARVLVGSPKEEGVRMGPLVSKEQVAEVSKQVGVLEKESERVFGNPSSFEVRGADKIKGAFLPPMLLYCKKPLSSQSVHEVEAFGPVSTVMGYSTLEEAIHLARLGDGSLCSSIFSADDQTARKLCLGVAPYHGRILMVNARCATESTGHGSPLPHLVHGGPGRAGGGEELGGIRSVLHYMQRTALQGSPQRLTCVTNRWIAGADTKDAGVHPFRKHFEDLEIGETLFTHGRTITESDIASFAGLSGDYFYAHTDDVAARESIFQGRVAHGYLVLSMAAGLFVHPAPGPVLANYGLDNLRFLRPVYIGDTIHVRLSCKQKTPKDNPPAGDAMSIPQGVVAWDVEVQNQMNETVAVYTILTLVKRRSS